MGEQSASTTELDISKSVGQLCEQLSITNITVPRIDTSRDIFEFLTEFEMVTESLPENQRNKLLAKAFSPGRYRSWYEVELKPYLATITWETIKTKIIERYSKIEDRDRHFKRLRSIKFDPNGSLELYDFVEDLLYSLSKAWPNEKDDTAKIRYIKSCLPSSIMPTLSSIPEFNSATTLIEFKKAFKRYDIIKEGSSDSMESSNKLNTPEIINLLKDIAKGIQNQNETITRSVVSALQPIQRSSPVIPERRGSIERPSRGRERGISPFDTHRQRSPSPIQQRYEHNNNSQQSDQSQGYYRRNYNIRPINNSENGPYYRAPTPPARFNNNDRNYMENNASRSDENHGQNNSIEVFSSREYFERHGRPPAPCTCGYMHWNRHCSQLKNLN